MSQFEPKSICILGRQPALGLAELESIYGAEYVKPLNNAALLDIEASEINFKRLGGVIKVAKVLAILPYVDWRKLSNYLSDNIPKHLAYLPEGTFTLGVSLYGIGLPVNKLNTSLLQLKKVIKQAGKPVRIVPNKSLELNSAQVFHNKLTHRGGWELLLIRSGSRTYLAQTLFVQDIEAYGARDQARPKRDARVGMLPPKLAQIIVNLATGPILRSQQTHLDGVQGDKGMAIGKPGKASLANSQLTSSVEQRSEAYKQYVQRVAEAATPQSAKSTSGAAGSASRQAGAVRHVVLDPFCGTGVILQEALLMGHNVMGSDIEPRMVEYSQTNLDWLVSKFKIRNSKFELMVADATKHKWQDFDSLATEAYLGRAFSAEPSEENLRQTVSDVNVIIKKFLQNLAPQTKPSFRLCIALPVWRTKNRLVHLPVIDHLTDMGYTRVDFVNAKNDDLIYFRPDQIVARQLLVLKRI